METLMFKGWAIKIEDLESMIMLCKKAGKEELKFGVACIRDEEIEQFIDPQTEGDYSYEKYKFFVRGCSFTSTGPFLAASLVATAMFDEFPPIPPEPVQDPGGG